MEPQDNALASINLLAAVNDVSSQEPGLDAPVLPDMSEVVHSKAGVDWMAYNSQKGRTTRKNPNRIRPLDGNCPLAHPKLPY
eukprot:3622403-Amphidinium_carterae.2